MTLTKEQRAELRAKAIAADNAHRDLMDDTPNVLSARIASERAYDELHEELWADVILALLDLADEADKLREENARLKAALADAHLALARAHTDFDVVDDDKIMFRKERDTWKARAETLTNRMLDEKARADKAIALLDTATAMIDPTVSKERRNRWLDDRWAFLEETS